jgi:hypothetical protein
MPFLAPGFQSVCILDHGFKSGLLSSVTYQTNGIMVVVAD